MIYKTMWYSNNMIEWAGHTVRMDDSHIPKAVMEECFRGKRTMGEPRCRWEDAVWISAMETDLENSSNEERRLEKEDRGDHGLKTG
jgi:hypothetical protein